MYFKANKLRWQVYLLTLCMFLSLNLNIYSQCERLVWANEFNDSGLDTTKWSYETGDGCPNLCQWGTGQLDYPTSRPENVRLENGHVNRSACQRAFGEGSEWLLHNRHFSFFNHILIKS